MQSNPANIDSAASSASAYTFISQFFPTPTDTDYDANNLEASLTDCPFFIDSDDASQVESQLLRARCGSYAISRSGYYYRFSVRVEPTPKNKFTQVRHHKITIRGNTISTLSDNTHLDDNNDDDASTFPNIMAYKHHLEAKRRYRGIKLDPINKNELRRGMSMNELSQAFFGADFERTHMSNNQNDTFNALIGQPPGTAFLRPSSSLMNAYVFAFVDANDKIHQHRFIICPTPGKVLMIGSQISIDDLPYKGEPPQCFRPGTITSNFLKGDDIYCSPELESADPIRLELFHTPVITPCEHIFEKSSLSQAISTQQEKHIKPCCPTCRDPRVKKFKDASQSNHPKLKRLLNECRQWRLANLDEDAIQEAKHKPLGRCESIQDYLARVKADYLKMRHQITRLEPIDRKLVRSRTYS